MMQVVHLNLLNNPMAHLYCSIDTPMIHIKSVYGRITIIIIMTHSHTHTHKQDIHTYKQQCQGIRQYIHIKTLAKTTEHVHSNV